MLSFPLIGYVLTAAFRDKVIYALILAVLLTCSLSVFLGSTAVVEQDYFALVFTASGLRLSIVLGLVLFVVFFVRRSFESKDIEFLLSRPISRVKFVTSYTFAFVLIAILMTCIQVACLLMLGSHLFGAGYVLWSLSLLVENVSMVAVAFFFSIYLGSSATAAMAAAAFYALARMMGSVLGALDAGVTVPAIQLVNHIMEGISLIVPRFDLMAQSSWLIYGVADAGDFIWVAAQGLTFGFLVLIATCIDLVRRQF